MRNKRQIQYWIQTSLDGGFDIIQNTIQGKIIAHTENDEAAKEIIRILDEKNRNK